MTTRWVVADEPKVLANTSNSIESTSGQTNFDNTDNGFVGLNEGEGPISIP